MIALDARRFRPTRLARLDRLARPSGPAALLADTGEPAAFPVMAAQGPVAARVASYATAQVLLPAPVTPALAPTGEARVLRRTRRVVRRRLRVDLAGLISASVSDGDITLRIETVSPRDPHLVEWTADRLVALVVLHDGCGARVIGGGGLMGRLELPSMACAGSFLAFCYDAEPGARRSETQPLAETQP